MKNNISLYPFIKTFDKHSDEPGSVKNSICSYNTNNTYCDFRLTLEKR